MFVENVNGTSFILDDTWLSNFDMQLFTDSAGGIGKGCWCYLFGKWSILLSNTVIGRRNMKSFLPMEMPHH
jgi:hypothetical protein